MIGAITLGKLGVDLNIETIGSQLVNHMHL